MKIALVSLALVLGTLIAVQGSINANLGRSLNHPLQAAMVNFLVGGAVLVMINLFIKAPFPDWPAIKSIPTYLFIGGVLGAIFVSMAIILIPRIGVANTLGAALVGQLIMSVIIDHFGWLGAQAQSLSPARIAGVALLLAGLYLVQK